MIKKEIEWFTPKEKTPEYSCHSGGCCFVHILISVKNLTMQGMYANGMYEIFGLPGASQNVDYWAYIPSPV